MTRSHAELPLPATARSGWPWEAGARSGDVEMPGWPRITIVTPSYNQGPFLEETMRSVLLQDYPNLEYMVCDGGSNDGSADVLERYRPWLDWAVSEPDRGQSAAINKGWRRASGDLLAWLNSDDVLMPGTLKRAAGEWLVRGRPAFIHGRSQVIDARSRPTGDVVGGPFSLEAALTAAQNPVAQPSAFVSRWALEEAGLLDEDLHFCMDWDLWLRLAVLGEPIFVPEVWSGFRIWQSSKTSTIGDASGGERVRVVERLFSTGEKPWPASLRRRSMAAAAAREAAGSYRAGNYDAFRAALWRSLRSDPWLAGGAARRLLPALIVRPQHFRKLAAILRRLSR